jgi:hypothetical protein
MINLGRTRMQPFTDKQIELIADFAAQLPLPWRMRRGSVSVPLASEKANFNVFILDEERCPGSREREYLQAMHYRAVCP